MLQKNSMMTTDRLFTFDELCDYLQVSRRHGAVLRDQVPIPFILVGKHKRYELARVITALKQYTAEKTMEEGQ